MRNRLLITALTIVTLVFLAARLVSQTTPASPARNAQFPVVADISGTGTQNQLARWTDSAGTLGDSGVSVVGGVVGIGTASPSAGSKLHVYSGAAEDAIVGMGTNPSAGPAFNIGYSGLSFGRGSAFLNVRPDALAIAPNPSLRFLTANTQRMIITNIGRVGIGTPNPTHVLDVNGTARVTGNLTVDGNIAAKYQDVAEWVASDSALEPGSVVIVDPNKVDEVRQSDRSYDTRVAGVVSPEPGIVLGVPGAGKFRIATVGRVRVKVDARVTPIRTGDLLVTSDYAGMAMRSQPLTVSGMEIHRPGTIVGKALQPLESGVGEILVLLSLQ